MNEKDFYTNGDLTGLLQESVGEILYFLGINNANGCVKIFRHYNIAGINYISTYIYKDSELNKEYTTVLHIQRSHEEYISRYDFVIEN